MSHLAIDQLSAALDGALAGPAMEQALAHLSSCARCRERQARLAGHDDALRHLLAHDPDDRVLDELARHSEAIATAIVRGLAVPAFATSTPLAGEEKTTRPAPRPDRVPVERLLRFQPPAGVGPASIPQDPTATPAKAGEALPPPREVSRAMHKPDAVDTNSPLDVTPRLDTERPPGKKAENPFTSIAEGYDVFNDGGYAGPTAKRLPPMLGGAPAKRDDDPGRQTPPREYRHGGVRRDTPTSTDRPREAPARRDDRAKAPVREEGFGVKRAEQPAWARLGLEPDPFSPGTFRDTLTGAPVSPPVIGPPPPAGRPGSSRSRTVLLALLVIAGAGLALMLATRIPTGARAPFGRPRESPSAATPAAVDARNAATKPPVDVAVPPRTDTPAATPGEARVCGVVVDVTGHPLEGARISVAGSTAQVHSDAEGRFCLVAAAGSQVVDVVDPRSAAAAPHTYRIEFAAGAPVARIVLP